MKLTFVTRFWQALIPAYAAYQPEIKLEVWSQEKKVMVHHLRADSGAVSLSGLQMVWQPFAVPHGIIWFLHRDGIAFPLTQVLVVSVGSEESFSPWSWLSWCLEKWKKLELLFESVDMINSRELLLLVLCKHFALPQSLLSAAGKISVTFYPGCIIHFSLDNNV